MKAIKSFCLLLMITCAVFFSVFSIWHLFVRARPECSFFILKLPTSQRPAAVQLLVQQMAIPICRTDTEFRTTKTFGTVAEWNTPQYVPRYPDMWETWYALPGGGHIGVLSRYDGQVQHVLYKNASESNRVLFAFKNNKLYQQDWHYKNKLMESVNWNN